MRKIVHRRCCSAFRNAERTVFLHRLTHTRGAQRELNQLTSAKTPFRSPNRVSGRGQEARPQPSARHRCRWEEGTLEGVPHLL